MTAPTEQADPPPAAAPVQHGWQQRAAATGVVVGAPATGTGIALAGAPWWAVAVCTVLAVVVPATVLMVQVLIPEESGHKLDLWREFLRHLEHRRRQRPGGRRGHR